MPTIKEKLLGDFDVALKNVNSLLVCGTASRVEAEAAIGTLTSIEADLKKLEERDVYDRCADIREAIKVHRFPVIAHKKVSENGRLVRVERGTKMVQVDLKAFCEYRRFSLDWYSEMQALNKRLTLRVATTLNMTPSEIKDVDDSYYMSQFAEKISLGEDPTSNTQCVKHLQRVLDLLCPNMGKANNHDLTYIMSCYSRRSNKAALKVVCANHRLLLSLLGDVAFNVSEKIGYGIEHKRKPASKVVAEKAEKKTTTPVPSVVLELPEEVSEEVPEEVSAEA